MKCSKAVLTLGAVGAGVLFSLNGASAQSLELPDGPGKAFVSENCTGCHGADLLTTQRRSSAEWEEVVNRMVANGDELTEDQYNEVLAYLGTYLGKTAASGSVPTSAGVAIGTTHTAQSAFHNKK